MKRLCVVILSARKLMVRRGRKTLQSLVSLSPILLFFCWKSITSAEQLPQSRDETFTLHVHPDLPTYTFRWDIEKEHDHLPRTIDVYQQGTEQVWQRIEIPMVPESWSGITPEDVNFDDYQDFKIDAYQGVTGNQSFMYWVFDPHTLMFTYSKALEELMNPQLHPNTHTISTHANLGCAGYCHIENSYQWNLDELIQMSSDIYDIISIHEETYGVHIHKERIDGMLKMVSGKIVSVDHLDDL